MKFEFVWIKINPVGPTFQSVVATRGCRQWSAVRRCACRSLASVTHCLLGPTSQRPFLCPAPRAAHCRLPASAASVSWSHCLTVHVHAPPATGLPPPISRRHTVDPPPRHFLSAQAPFHPKASLFSAAPDCPEHRRPLVHDRLRWSAAPPPFDFHRPTWSTEEAYYLISHFID
jgi:hypothetical protein